MALSNIDFAYHASRLARRAADWAADSIMPGMSRDQPISAESVDRFLKDQRYILDLIERTTRNQ